jgi:hypothetical protein
MSKGFGTKVSLCCKGKREEREERNWRRGVGGEELEERKCRTEQAQEPPQAPSISITSSCAVAMLRMLSPALTAKVWEWASLSMKVMYSLRE